MSVGLRQILEKILPFGVVKVYSSAEELREINPEDIFHIFVSTQILIENIPQFDALRNKTIALTRGGSNTSALQGYHQINIEQTEEEILHSITSLHSSAHGPRHPQSAKSEPADLLSAREIEVAKLLIEGLINKEIAERLGIGVTTVITHRKNIFEKLGIRSVAGLTIYAIMKRYIEI